MLTQITLPQHALVVLVGVAGAGKSTLAAQAFPADAVVSTDRLRAMIADDPTEQRYNRRVFEIAHALIRARLEAGRLAVMDATCTTREARHTLLEIGCAVGVPVYALVLDRSLEEALQQSAARATPVPEHVLVRQHHQLLDGLHGLWSEGFTRVFLVDSAVEVTLV